MRFVELKEEDRDRDGNDVIVFVNTSKIINVKIVPMGDKRYSKEALGYRVVINELPDRTPLWSGKYKTIDDARKVAEKIMGDPAKIVEINDERYF